MISQVKTRAVLLRSRLHSLRALELVSNKDRSGFCLGEWAVQQTHSRLCLPGCKAALEAGRRLCKLVCLRINASGINLTKLSLKGHLGLVPPGSISIKSKYSYTVNFETGFALTLSC
jgi:hypothetical protein